MQYVGVDCCCVLVHELLINLLGKGVLERHREVLEPTGTVA